MSLTGFVCTPLHRPEGMELRPIGICTTQQINHNSRPRIRLARSLDIDVWLLHIIHNQRPHSPSPSDSIPPLPIPDPNLLPLSSTKTSHHRDSAVGSTSYTTMKSARPVPGCLKILIRVGTIPLSYRHLVRNAGIHSRYHRRGS